MLIADHASTYLASSESLPGLASQPTVVRDEASLAEARCRSALDSTNALIHCEREFGISSLVYLSIYDSSLVSYSLHRATAYADSVLCILHKLEGVSYNANTIYFCLYYCFYYYLYCCLYCCLLPYRALVEDEEVVGDNGERTVHTKRGELHASTPS